MKAQLLIAMLVAVFSVCAKAGSQTGTVTQIVVRSTDGLVYVYLSGTATSRVGCASATPYWMIADENSTSGKQQLGQLSLAFAAGKTVTIVGTMGPGPTGTCKRWGDGEDIGSVAVNY